MTRAALATLALCLATGRSASALTEEETQALGAEVYGIYCIGCHGAAGDGKGPAARMLVVKPRDFTSGIFKFRSTPSGARPTDEDLLHIVTNGVNQTAMPPFAPLLGLDRRVVVEYVKAFHPGREDAVAAEPIELPAPPAWLGSPESVARGRRVYALLACAGCHGEDGRGDGPSASVLAPDIWGNAQKPFDLMRDALKSGDGAVDVYRTFMTGLNGTAMPSYADVFAAPDGRSIREGDAWHLVSYVVSLRAAGREEDEQPGDPLRSGQSPRPLR